MNYENPKISIYVGGGKSTLIELERHKAPIIVERIIRELPVEAMMTKLGNYALIQLSIKAPLERRTYVFKEGEVAYDPMQQALLIFLMNGHGRFTPAGKVLKGLDVIKNALTPRPVKISLHESS